MEKKLDHRSWDELMPDMLSLIFKRLELEQKLVVVPRVCKAWAKATKFPDYWQEIDMREWSLYSSEYSVNRMLALLIGRSSGSLQKLSVYDVSKFGLSLISANANNLRSLELPGSEISNSMVEQIAEKLSNLTHLDLSYCLKIGAPAIEAIGKNCKQLTQLERNMRYRSGVTLEKCEDAEALAIAATMPQLKVLELAYMNVTTEGVLRILANCPELEFLNVSGCGCRNVKLDDEFLKKRSKLNVMGLNVHSATVDDDVDMYSFAFANSLNSAHSVNVHTDTDTDTDDDDDDDDDDDSDSDLYDGNTTVKSEKCV